MHLPGFFIGIRLNLVILPVSVRISDVLIVDALAQELLPLLPLYL